MGTEIEETIFATFLTKNTFYIDETSPLYRSAIIALKSKGYLITPHINPDAFELSELGKIVLQNGGWKAYNRQLELNKTIADKKAIYELKISRRNSNWGWIPYIISILAFITSVTAISIAYKSYQLAESKKSIELKSNNPPNRNGHKKKSS